MNCPKCGAEAPDNSTFCNQCGAPLAGAPAAPADQLAQAAQASRNAPDEAEQELWSGGYSAKDMIGAWLGAALLSAVAAGGGFLVANVLGLLAGLAASAVIWVVLLGVLAYRKLSISYRLTSQRFIHQVGLLSRVTNRIEVLDIDDVTFQQGIVDRLMGTGTIVVLSSDKSHPKLVLSGIDNVQNVSELIDNTRRKERRRRGLHIEAI